MSENHMYADIRVPANLNGEFRCLAEVNANDADGVRVLDVREGDTISIRSVTGWCSFSTKSKLGMFRSAVSVVVPMAAGGLPAAAQTAINAAKKLGAFTNRAPAKGSKVRNGFGKERGKSDFATKEGGLIVCMPNAYEPIHAADDTYLHEDAKKNGRLVEYVPTEIRNQCFFPCKKRNGRMGMVVPMDGTVWILAFDKDHDDNEGVYEVEFSILRG